MVDVAASLSDGRWDSQKRRMRKSQFVLCGGRGGDRSLVEMVFIVEGKISSQNTIDNKWVGKRSYNVTIDDAEQAIEALEMEFRVIKTDAMLSIGIEQLLEDEVANHDFSPLLPSYDYNEFKLKVRETDDIEGDPPPPRSTPPLAQKRNPYAKTPSSSSSSLSPPSLNPTSPPPQSDKPKNDNSITRALMMSTELKVPLKTWCERRKVRASGTKEQQIQVSDCRARSVIN